MRIEWSTEDVICGLNVISGVGYAHRISMTHDSAQSAVLIRLSDFRIVLIGTLEEMVSLLNRDGYFPADPQEGVRLLEQRRRHRWPDY